MSLSARFGIARFGASRFGAYSPSLYVAVTGSGNLSSSVDLASIEIIDRLNDQPNEARLTFVDDVGVAAGMNLIISLGGSSGGRLFGGTVMTVELQQGKYHQRPTYAIHARDYVWYLNRKLANKTYTNRSITEIVTDLVGTYCSGGFPTTNQVEAGLPVLDVFTVTDTYLSRAFSDLSATTDGLVWFVDDYGDLFFGDSATLTGPATLDANNKTFWGLKAPTDISQVRTRVIVEGRRQKIMVDVPVGATSIPINYGWGFPTSGVSGESYVRINQDIYRLDTTTHLIGPPFAMVDTDVLPGDTTINVDDTTALSNGGSGWVHTAENGMTFSFAGVVGSSTLIGIPASGYGSISGTPGETAILTGQALYATDELRLLDPTVTAINAGDYAVSRVSLDDTAAQTAMIALEGGDGIHEFYTKTDSAAATYEGDAIVAQAILDRYSAALQTVEFGTRNRLAQSGREITVSLSGETDIALTTVIQQVTIAGFDTLSLRTQKGNVKRWPTRDVEAAPTRRISIGDVIAGPLNF